jgi:hypothetical protein
MHDTASSSEGAAVGLNIDDIDIYFAFTTIPQERA